jgi:hypothetical protein
MKVSDIQSVSASQDRSICSTDRKFWTSTRSISDPDSPSSLSAVSEQLSDLSHIETNSSDPSNLLPSPLPSLYAYPTSSDVPFDLSSPITRLSLPQFPIPAEPIPSMTMSSSTMYPLA